MFYVWGWGRLAAKPPTYPIPNKDNVMICHSERSDSDSYRNYYFLPDNNNYYLKQEFPGSKVENFWVRKCYIISGKNYIIHTLTFVEYKGQATSKSLETSVIIKRLGSRLSLISLFTNNQKMRTLSEPDKLRTQSKIVLLKSKISFTFAPYTSLILSPFF